MDIDTSPIIAPREARCVTPAHAWFDRFEAEPYQVEVGDRTVSYITLRCSKCSLITGSRLVRRSDAYSVAIDYLTDIITALDDLTMWARAELPAHAIDAEITDVRTAYSKLCHDVLAYRDVAEENES